MKLKTMLESAEALGQLIDCNMTPRAAMRVGLTAKRIEEYINIFKEQEVKIFQMYGTEVTDDDGNTGWLAKSTEDQQKIQEEVNTLLDEEFELDVLQISFDDILGEVTPKIVANLEWLFEDIEAVTS